MHKLDALRRGRCGIEWSPRPYGSFRCAQSAERGYLVRVEEPVKMAAQSALVTHLKRPVLAHLLLDVEQHLFRITGVMGNGIRIPHCSHRESGNRARA